MMQGVCVRECYNKIYFCFSLFIPLVFLQYISTITSIRNDALGSVAKSTTLLKISKLLKIFWLDYDEIIEMLAYTLVIVHI